MVKFNDFVRAGNLYRSWRRFRRGKANRSDVIAFERHLEDELQQLSAELVAGTYTHQPYEQFYVRDPKYRVIHKAAVRDRVVHQALYDVLYPIFDRRFFFDSYSCRRTKGTHAAITRIAAWVRSESRNYRREVFVLHGDVDDFFSSVNHAILCKLLSGRVDDARYLALCWCIVESFTSAPGTGIPLGNLTSQLFANIYLHELDYHIKQQLRVRCYGRYNDDFFIVSADCRYLESLARTIPLFLGQSLLLAVPPAKLQLRSLSHGVDVLGAVLFPHGLVPRRRLRRAAQAIALPSWQYTTVTQQQLNSYLGLLGHTKGFLLQEQIRLALRLSGD